MHTYEQFLPSSQHTYNSGQKLAKLLGQTKALILLSGDLGAGKTTFAQGFMSELMPHQVVASPTYSYMNIYETPSLIFHFDLYRISSVKELEELGLWEHLLDHRAIRLVEWPEHACGLEKYADLHLNFEIKDGLRQMWVTYLKSIGGIT